MLRTDATSADFTHRKRQARQGCSSNTTWIKESGIFCGFRGWPRPWIQQTKIQSWCAGSRCFQTTEMVSKAGAVTEILWSHRYYKNFLFRPNKSPLRSLMKLFQLRFENITLTNWITDKSAPSERHPGVLINTPFQSQYLHVQPVTDRFNKTVMSKFLDSTSMTHLSLWFQM